MKEGREPTSIHWSWKSHETLWGLLMGWKKSDVTAQSFYNAFLFENSELYGLDCLVPEGLVAEHGCLFLPGVWMPTTSPQSPRTASRGSLSSDTCGWMTTVWRRCPCTPSAICPPCRRSPWLSTKSPASPTLRLPTCRAWWSCKYPPHLMPYSYINLGAQNRFLSMKGSYWLCSWRVRVWESCLLYKMKVMAFKNTE